MVPRRGLPPRTTNLSILPVYVAFIWKWVSPLVQEGFGALRYPLPPLFCAKYLDSIVYGDGID
jgi:hypothetical protein